MKKIKEEIKKCNRAIDFYSRTDNQRGFINSISINDMEKQIKILKTKL